MGRRKIEIQPITHERNRSVTFLKRKNGLFKKAYELGVLCSVDVAVIIFDEKPGQHEKLYEYSSKDIRDIVKRHTKYQGEKDNRGPSDFSGNPTKLEDIGEGDDDEDDDVANEAPVKTKVKSKTKPRSVPTPEAAPSPLPAAPDANRKRSRASSRSRSPLPSLPLSSVDLFALTSPPPPPPSSDLHSRMMYQQLMLQQQHQQHLAQKRERLAAMSQAQLQATNNPSTTDISDLVAFFDSVGEGSSGSMNVSDSNWLDFLSNPPPASSSSNPHATPGTSWARRSNNPGRGSDHFGHPSQYSVLPNIHSLHGLRSPPVVSERQMLADVFSGFGGGGGSGDSDDLPYPSMSAASFGGLGMSSYSHPHPISMTMPWPTTNPNPANVNPSHRHGNGPAHAHGSHPGNFGNPGLINVDVDMDDPQFSNFARSAVSLPSFGRLESVDHPHSHPPAKKRRTDVQPDSPASLSDSGAQRRGSRHADEEEEDSDGSEYWPGGGGSEKPKTTTKTQIKSKPSKGSKGGTGKERAREKEKKVKDLKTPAPSRTRARASKVGKNTAGSASTSSSITKTKLQIEEDKDDKGAITDFSEENDSDITTMRKQERRSASRSESMSPNTPYAENGTTTGTVHA